MLKCGSAFFPSRTTSYFMLTEVEIVLSLEIHLPDPLPDESRLVNLSREGEVGGFAIRKWS